MKKISLVLIFLLVSSKSFSQKLKDFISYDTLIYAFKLDKEQTDMVIKKNKIDDTSILFTHLFKSYPRAVYKDDTLPEGNYIIVSIEREFINYRFIERSNLSIKSKVIDDKILIFLSDIKKKNIIEKANVQLNGSLVKFDDGYGAYVFSKSFLNMESLKSNKNFITISYGNEYLIRNCNFIAGYKEPSVKPQRFRTSGGPTEGYLITDKPVYHPGDSMRLKAFLMNPINGRSIRKRSRLTITEPMQQFVFTKRIKPASKGAYLFSWQIPDTLKIDRTFQIHFNVKKGWASFYRIGSFYLEDYVLNNNHYDMSLRNDLFFSGEDIKFFVSAKDANQFPMSGTLIHYKLSMQQITDFLGDTMTLPEAKRINLIEKDTIYPNDNFMELTIPSSCLPKVNAQYQLEVSFTDPVSYERKVMTRQFNKMLEKEKVIMYQKEDSMYLRCLYNLRDTNRPYHLIAMSNQDTLFKKDIMTPYSFKLSPYCTKVIYVNKDSVVTPVDIVFQQLNITGIKGVRNADSILISFSFPFDEPVYYRIYKKNQLVKSGKSKKLDFRIRDESSDPYSIILTTNVNGAIENNFFQLTYRPLIHHIKLSSTIPQQAFPGQTLPVTITATDYKDKPLRNVNIAAYAVNKQFESKLQIPQIIIPEIFEDRIQIHPIQSIDQISLSIPNLNQSYKIQTRHLAKYSLQKNEYYELRYPRKDMAFLSDKIQSSTPEFAVTVTHKNNLYTPKYILLDSELVYISDLNKDPYSFPVKAGNHEITIRYFNKKIILHDVQFMPNRKYWIGINYDSLSKGSMNMTIEDSCKVAQPDEKEKVLLYNTILLTNYLNFNSLSVRNKKDSIARYRYANGMVPQSLNIDGDMFYAYGPLKANSNAILSLNNKEHTLKISSEYAHYYDQSSGGFNTKHLGIAKGIIFAFNENLMQDYQLSQLLKADTVPKAIEKANMKYDEKAYRSNLKETPAEYNQNYRAQSSQHYFSIKIKNDDKYQYVKALWIINNSKPDESDFVPGIGRINLFSYFKYGVDGQYDFYFLMNEGKLLKLKNVRLNNHDEFYINPLLFKTETLSNDKLGIPLKIYNDLTKLPLLPFYYSPEDAHESCIEKQDSKRSNPYLHGIITNKALNPIPSVLILVEINGQYKYGAITNANGEFEILDMPAGNYQLKIYHPDFVIKHYHSMFFKQGNSYELTASLNPIESQRPVLETIHQNFRFMVFKDKQEREMMKIQVYDKDSRNILNGASIAFIESHTAGEGAGKIVDIKKMNIQHEMDIPFPISGTQLYTIEIKREGYIPILLHNIRFIRGMKYGLSIFLTPEDKEKMMKQLEYDVKMTSFSMSENNSLLTRPENIHIIEKQISDKQIKELSGIVSDENKRKIDYAVISIYQGGILKEEIKTDLHGKFILRPQTSGICDMRIRALGYKEAIIKKIEIRGGKKIQLEIRLERQIIDNENVELTINAPNIYMNEPGVYNTSPTMNYAASPVYTNGGLATDMLQSEVFSINASRKRSVQYLVDGTSIESRLSDEQQLDNISRQYGKPGEVYADEEMIHEVMDDADLNKTRKYFSDNGFWEPNHITNKQGKVSFEIKLPDNITTWKSNILAIGKHRLHGIDSVETRVFKPLQTTSELPQFMWDQDKINVRVKFTNFTKETKKVKIHVSINDQSSLSKEVSIKHDFVDSLVLTAAGLKPVIWKAGLTYEQKYKDEEERIIPVFSSAFRYFANQHFIMDEDSLYTMKFAGETKGNILLNNTLYEKIIAEIKDLNQYEYNCVEQAASKLKALLCFEKINKAIGRKENLTASIYALINRLGNYQNNDGTWGWWKSQSVNWRITLYAMEVLQTAEEMGYSNIHYTAARNAVNANYDNMNISDKLIAFYLLQKMRFFNDDMQAEFNQINVDDLQAIDKLYFYKIKSTLGTPIELGNFYALMLEMKNKLQVPYNDHFMYDPRSSIFSAYQLFSKTELGNEWLMMFKDKLMNGQLEKNLNTYSKALMIEALTSSQANTGNKTVNAEVIINDTLKVKSFPFSMPINGSSYKFKHTGGNVYVNSSEENFEFHPNISDSIFKVSTSFSQNGLKSARLKAGIPCSMKVVVDAYRSKDYIMLEIPVPSGMRIVNKNQIEGGSIEFFKNRIIVYYQQFSMGKHELQFEMIPNLKGNFIIPAAKCSLMYYPYIFGNNESSEMSIY